MCLYAVPDVAVSNSSCRTRRMIPDAVPIPHIIIDDIPIKREAEGIYNNSILDINKLRDHDSEEFQSAKKLDMKER
jgi:hypothetical protein